VAKICLCLTGETLARNLEILEKYRKYIDVAELRVDLLDPDERFLIRRFPEMAGIPVILTIRRDVDGGAFNSGEGSRVHLFSRGLAFAEADRRKNFAYVDLEEDLNVPSLEEAARTFSTRIIRSFHNIRGMESDIAGKIKSLVRAGDELPKVALAPQSIGDVLSIFQAARETAGLDKILLGMGPFGLCTRVLAEKLGSYMTYTSAIGELNSPLAAPGQLDPVEMAEFYRFRTITDATKIFAVTGYPLKVSDSPKIFNTIFALENANAVYLPIPSDNLAVFMSLADIIGLSGVSVTVPYKEEILHHCAHKAAELEGIGACNTIVRFLHGWLGVNTDTKGFSESLLAFIRERSFKGKKITVIGAGGAARALLWELHRQRARVLVLNRSPSRARDLAALYRFKWGGLDSQGSELMEKYSEIIVQATSAGMEGHEQRDPLELYKFRGNEVVMDLIYKPEMTQFLSRAAAAGCRVINGRNMLLRQAQYQYREFMGKELPDQILDRVVF
jgi:3-dehydroquinate dehydratase/shikimate dehydrogenase